MPRKLEKQIEDISCDNALVGASRNVEHVAGEPRFHSHEIKSILKYLNVMLGRHFFIKLKEITDLPLEATAHFLHFSGGINSYKYFITELFRHLFTTNLILSEIHADILYNFKNNKKSNQTLLMLDYKKNILDFSFKIDEEIKQENNYINQIIKHNKKWLTLEREFSESVHKLQKSESILNSTSYQEQKRMQIKKRKKIQLINCITEIILGIMSVHKIDYRKNDRFRQILLRVNLAKNLVLSPHLPGDE